MQRRQFIQQTTLATVAILTSCQHNRSLYGSGAQEWRRVLADSISSPTVDFPREKRIPLGWAAFPVSAEEKAGLTKIRFPEESTRAGRFWLRLATTIDLREPVKISAFLAESGEELGVFDLHYAHPFQPFQIEIADRRLEAIIRQGVALKMIQGSKDAWFFAPDPERTDSPGLRPQLLLDGRFDPESAFRTNLLSMNAFSPFGWMGGCVHDALYEMYLGGDMEALNALRMHLECYLDKEKGIIFESPMTTPKDGDFNSIEDFLPFAAIVGLYPDHPAIDMALNYIQSREQPDGLIRTGKITTEGCYTLAYPLAAMAVARKDRSLAEKALRQILHRAQRLSDDRAIYQQATPEGERSYANWGRGVAWHLLGMIKTIKVLKESPFRELPGLDEAEAVFKRSAARVASFQNIEGLWHSFLDRPATGPDTSATAGIAAALAWGHQLRLLDSAYRTRARRSYRSLTGYLTPDGFLTSVSQINRGGEALQASGYRVISQFGLGLLGQLRQVLFGV